MLADGEAGSGAAGLVLMRVALADAGGGTGAAANIGDTGLCRGGTHACGGELGRRKPRRAELPKVVGHSSASGQQALAGRGETRDEWGSRPARDEGGQRQGGCRARKRRERARQQGRRTCSRADAASEGRPVAAGSPGSSEVACIGRDLCLWPVYPGDGTL
jgi:hypothetical protein